MIRPVNSAKRPFLRMEAGAAINAGQVLVISSGEAVPAAGGASAATVVGVAVEDAASGALVYIYPPDQEFEFDIYQGGAVDVGALANQGEIYDIYVDGAAGDGSAEGEMYLDLNDTSGAIVALSKYDNTRRVATGSFTIASRYL